MPAPVSREPLGVLMISYMSDGLEKALSNLNSYPFIFYGKQFTSMEGFLQSQKTSNVVVQEKFATLFGIEAWQEGQKYNDWKDTQILSARGRSFFRDSGEYQVLLCQSYDALFHYSEELRNALYASLPFALDHDGKTDIRDSVLTKHEYLFQLYRLRAKLAYPP